MKKSLALGIAIFTGSLLASTAAFGQLLYSENFDDGSASARWQVNTTGLGLDLTVDPAVSKPLDSNFDWDADGVVDDLSGFAFDYSTVGIPSAPNSTGGSTTGLKIQANVFSDSFGGISLSPLGQSFTGDYVLSYDMWQNYNGPLDSGFAGTTQVSYGGILTSGTTSNYVGSSDGLFFASTGDGDSSADYRAYSSDRPVSYQWPRATPQDDAAYYFAESRNNAVAYYTEHINPAPDPVNAPTVGSVTAPAEQLALFPNQTGTVRAGAMGMAWYHHEITKIGDIVTWSVNGTPLVEVNLSLYVGAQPTGTNILFGHSDTGQASSTDFNAQFMLFTLVDNVEVNAISTVGENADFDNDGDVDGLDFLTWQRGFGAPDAQPGDGDANGDHVVDGDDLLIWQNQYGTGGLVALSTVPEPSTLVSLLGATLLLGLRRRG